MLNLFPIQFLAPLAYLLLRVCVGALYIYLGRTHIRDRGHTGVSVPTVSSRFGLSFVLFLGLMEVLIGVLFIVGFLTQLAALVSIVLSLIFLRACRHPEYSLPLGRPFYILLLTASFSLFVTGAGIFAFDLPI